MDPIRFLTLLMEREDLNATSLARKTHNRTKQPQIHRYLSGAAREPRRSTWAPVAAYFKCDVEAFFRPDVAQREAQRLGLVDSVNEQRPPYGVAMLRDKQTVPEPSPRDIIIGLGRLLAKLPEKDRVPTGKLLDAFAVEGGSPSYVDLIVGKLSPDAHSKQVSM